MRVFHALLQGAEILRIHANRNRPHVVLSTSAKWEVVAIVCERFDLENCVDQLRTEKNFGQSGLSDVAHMVASQFDGVSELALEHSLRRPQRIDVIFFVDLDASTPIGVTEVVFPDNENAITFFGVPARQPQLKSLFGTPNVCRCWCHESAVQ